MYRTHHYVTTLRMNQQLFRAAEKTFLSEIKRLDRKINRQVTERNTEIKKINAQMSLKGTGLEGDYAPDHPLNQHDDNRLTKRGIEICYRLFDLGKSDMAIAHLMRLSLAAVKAAEKAVVETGRKEASVGQS